MHKELNPDLFNEKKNSKSLSGEAGATNETAQMGIDRQIFDLRMQNHALTEQLNKLTSAMNEFSKNTNMKLDRHQQTLLRLEQNQNNVIFEAGQKFNQMNQKIAERKVSDAKVQEMVERHNNIVKSFEVRMNHLQKLLAEKDSQTNTMHAALNETKMELARLKRL